MQRRRNGVRIHVDRYTKFCLTAIAGLLTVLIVGLWAQRGPGSRTAWGKAKEPFVDAGRQRATMIKELQRSNKTLEEMLTLLKSGKVKVQAVPAEDKVPGGGDVRTSEPRKTPGKTR